MTDAAAVSASVEEKKQWPGSASTPPGRTDPADYALVNLIFFAGAGGLVALSRRQAARGQAPIPRAELPVLALGTFALAQVIAKEKVSTWIREPFVEESGDHRPVRPEGHGLRHAIGELLTCTRCLGAWGGLGLVTLRTASPAGGRAVSTLLATAGANSFLQSAFRLLCETTDRQARKAEREAVLDPS